MRKKNESGFGVVEFLIVAVLIIAVGFGGWYLAKRSNKPSTASTTSPAGNSQVTTSEQSNQAKFAEFFTSFNLAKLAVGKHISPPNDLPVNTTTFSSNDQLCENMIVKKLIPSGSLSSAVYGVSTKQDAVPKTVFPNELGPGPGTSSGCGTLGVGVGKYEYKAYIDDVLVVDQPFEVK